jgi:hypothetical protein
MAKKASEVIKTNHLYPIQTLDPQNKSLGGVLISAESPNGNWSGMTDKCGWFIPYLTSGHYKVTFSKSGFENVVQEWDLLESPRAPIFVGLAYSSGNGTLPPIPTRSEVCSIQTSLQGMTYETKQYGPFPAWFYAKLTPEDRAAARRTHKEAGDTHIHISISAAYDKEGTLWPKELREGYDFTQDLDGFRAILTEVICDGLFVDVPLAGDGLGVGPGYNDPIGKTYGHGWLVANLERILLALKGGGDKPDLTKYVIFRPGWDAVFYGWGGSENGNMSMEPGLDEQQTRVKQFGEQFRKILPDGYLAIEHTPGNIPVGLGPSDWETGGIMSTYDTLMGEFATVHQDSFWQVLGRCIDPYNRPPDQPPNDDPNPPKYLPGQSSSRGPYFYVAFEPTTGGVYEWCRGNCTLEQVREVDSYMRACGATLTGFSQ